jgi:O-antigen ligase
MTLGQAHRGSSRGSAMSVADGLAATPHTPFQVGLLRTFFSLFLATLFFTISGMELMAWVLVGTLIVMTVVNNFGSTDVSWRNFASLRKELSLGCDTTLLLFFVAIAVSTFVRVPVSDWLDVIGEMRWIVILYFLAYYVKGHLSLNSEKVLFRVAPVFIFLGLCALRQFATGLDPLRSHNNFLKPFGDTTFRAIGSFNIPLTFAYSFGFLGTVFSVAFLMRRRTYSGAKQIVGILAIGCIFCGVLATGVRGAWLAGGVTLVSLLPFMPRRVAFSAIVCSVAIVAALIGSSESVCRRAVSIVDLREHSNAGRFKIWRGHLAIASDYPILGVGLGQSNKHVGRYYEQLGIRDGQVGHAHNNFVEFLAGTGIVGLTLYVCVCTFFLRRSYAAYRRHRDQDAGPPGFYASLSLGAFAAQIYLHTGGMTEVNFTDGEVNHAIVFVWAVVIALDQRSRVAKPNVASDGGDQSGGHDFTARDHQDGNMADQSGIHKEAA